MSTSVSSQINPGTQATHEKYLEKLRFHITSVRLFGAEFLSNLQERLKVHDQSKFAEPELSGFAKISEDLEGIPYGSEEYQRIRNRHHMSEIISLHYRFNSHHPEHHAADQVDALRIRIEQGALN